MNDPRYSKEVLALALARESVARLRRTHGGQAGYGEDVRHLLTAFDVLDNAGVFSPVDRQTDYTAAADVLSANAADRFVSPAGLAFSQIRHPSGQETVDGTVSRLTRRPEPFVPDPDLTTSSGVYLGNRPDDDTDDGRF